MTLQYLPDLALLLQFVTSFSVRLNPVQRHYFHYVSGFRKTDIDLLFV